MASNDYPQTRVVPPGAWESERTSADASAMLEAEETRLLEEKPEDDRHSQMWAAPSLMEHESSGVPLGKADMPHFDRDRFTQIACSIGLNLTYALALSSLATSSYVIFKAISCDDSSRRCAAKPWMMTSYGKSGYPNSITPTLRTIIELALSVLVTVSTEAVGYIHTVSLRWALQREEKLEFNSNLRLLAHAESTIMNSWYCNSICAISLVVSYAAASQVLVLSHKDDAENVYYNGFALLVLGLSLLVQATVAQACVFKHTKNIKTWTSNPLVVSLACLHESGKLQHRSGRSLISVGDNLSARSGVSSTKTEPQSPKRRQPSLIATDRWVRIIVAMTWTLAVATLIWAGVAFQLMILDRLDAPYSFDTYTLSLGRDTRTDVIFGLLLVVCFQSFATLGLHSVELLVNRCRDEDTWRRLGSQRQKRLLGKRAPNALLAAITSWQSLSLLALKPLVHWLFGQSLSILHKSNNDDHPRVVGYMLWQFVFGLGGAAVAVATLATVLATYRPRGSMPATWGHLQTLVDLIDDWGDGNVQELFWGDKGQHGDGIRYAGTSGTAGNVGYITMNCMYR